MRWTVTFFLTNRDSQISQTTPPIQARFLIIGSICPRERWPVVVDVAPMRKKNIDSETSGIVRISQRGEPMSFLTEMTQTPDVRRNPNDKR